VKEKNDDAAEKCAGETREAIAIKNRAGSSRAEGDGETRDVECDKPHP